ncbi:hypothetical protein JNJ66_01085 [Candidatus Saccharibacteria bacterium]|nr:hypothetical protein [Candidatus Saccharibacteria bacterium]
MIFHDVDGGKYWCIGVPTRAERVAIMTGRTAWRDRAGAASLAVAAAALCYLVLVQWPVAALLQGPYRFGLPVVAAVAVGWLALRRIRRRYNILERMVPFDDVRMERMLRSVPKLTLGTHAGHPVSKRLIDRYLLAARGLAQVIEDRRSGGQNAGVDPEGLRASEEKFYVSQLDEIVQILVSWLLDRDIVCAALDPGAGADGVAAAFVEELRKRSLVN